MIDKKKLKNVAKDVAWNAAWYAVYATDGVCKGIARRFIGSRLVIAAVHDFNEVIVGAVDRAKKRLDPLRWASDVEASFGYTSNTPDYRRSFPSDMSTEWKDWSESYAKDLYELGIFAEENGISTKLHDMAGMVSLGEAGSPGSIFGEQGGIFAGNDDFED